MDESTEDAARQLDRSAGLRGSQERPGQTRGYGTACERCTDSAGQSADNATRLQWATYQLLGRHSQVQWAMLSSGECNLRNET